MYRRIEVINTQKTIEEFDGKLTARNLAWRSMIDTGLPDARIKYRKMLRRFKFFFTEKGWKQCGHAVLSEIRKTGFQSRIISLKENDPRIKIVYKDNLQLIISMRKKSLTR